MVTGIEAAGLVLAILPMLVNQIDNYALGVERTKGFRTYKVQLEDYAIELGAQYAILLNTLELSLEGVVDNHDKRSELIGNPKGPAWKDPELEIRLKEKLGRGYEAFKGTVGSLCSLLEYLSLKLGVEKDYVATSTTPFNVLKFRKTFSSAVYKDLLGKIDKTNQTLKTLFEQSQHLEQSKRGPSSYRRRNNLKRHRDQRRHGRDLYRIMVQEKNCWSCVCQDTHVIGLQLASSSHQFEPEKPGFRMMLSSAANNSILQPRRWSQVELEAYENLSQCSTYEDNYLCTGTNSTQHMVQSNLNQTQTRSSKVRFSASYCAESEHGSSFPPHGQHVDNICSVLHQNLLQNNTCSSRGTRYLGDETTDIRYYINRVDSSQDEIHLHSLKETFQIPSSSSSAYSYQYPDDFGRDDSLYLATVLACSVLHFHGTWLEANWSTQDILFLRTDQSQLQYQQPYILRRVSGEGLSNKGKEREWFSNEVLFPLAVALIELSLGRCIRSERLDEDEGMSEHETQYNTATRLLRSKVYKTSGHEYGDVVKECLNWSQGQRRGYQFEDAHFDESVFDLIISPLLREFDHFRGVTSRV